MKKVNTTQDGQYHHGEAVIEIIRNDGYQDRSGGNNRSGGCPGLNLKLIMYKTAGICRHFIL